MLPDDYYRYVFCMQDGVSVIYFRLLFLLSPTFLAAVTLWFARLSKLVKRKFCRFKLFGLHTSHYSINLDDY